MRGWGQTLNTTSVNTSHAQPSSEIEIWMSPLGSKKYNGLGTWAQKSTFGLSPWVQKSPFGPGPWAQKSYFGLGPWAQKSNFGSPTLVLNQEPRPEPSGDIQRG